MAKWFEQDRERLGTERQKLLESGFTLDATALSQRGRVEFCGIINDGQNDVEIRIICEDGFPYRIPLFIAPQLPLTPQSRHITFRTKSICLRTAKPQEWRNTNHIVDLIPDAARILRGQLTNEFGEEHVAPDQDLFGSRSSENHLIIPKDLQTPPESSIFKMHVSKRLNGRAMLAFKSGSSQTGLKFDIVSSQDYFIVFRLREMPLATISELDNLLGTPNPNYERMLQEYAVNPAEAITQFNNLKRKRKRTYFGVVFPYQTGWYWQFFKFDLVRKKQISINPIGTSGFNTLTARLSGVLDIDNLGKKTVLIAGCGGIGSTVAVELACAGVGNLFLNDPDTVSVANVVRHECSLAFLGAQKSNAVKSKIATKNPLTRVIVAGDIFSDPEFESKLQQSDIVVCAIGDYNIDEYINQLCVKHNKPMIFAYIGVYGSMGHVVRLSVKEAETGCFKCFQRYLESKGIPDLPEIADINSVTVELGCNNPSLPAASFDQRTVALLAVRKTIQSLDPKSYVDDDADAIVFYARQVENMVDQSLKIKNFGVQALEDCPICGDGAPR